MTKKEPGFKTFLKVTVIVILFLSMGGVIAFKAGVLGNELSHGDGLSGLVSVKGTVSVDDLNLSRGEVKKINRTVAAHKDTFTQVDVFLDVKGNPSDMDKDSVLVLAMVLETNGECEVRSWSRKVTRGDLVPQMIVYIQKAAKEYEDFKRYPEVKQNFKCLYI